MGILDFFSGIFREGSPKDHKIRDEMLAEILKAGRSSQNIQNEPELPDETPMESEEERLERENSEALNRAMTMPEHEAAMGNPYAYLFTDPHKDDD